MEPKIRDDHLGHRTHPEDFVDLFLNLTLDLPQRGVSEVSVVCLPQYFFHALTNTESAIFHATSGLVGNSVQQRHMHSEIGDSSPTFTGGWFVKMEFAKGDL